MSKAQRLYSIIIVLIIVLFILAILVLTLLGIFLAPIQLASHPKSNDFIKNIVGALLCVFILLSVVELSYITFAQIYDLEKRTLFLSSNNLKILSSKDRIKYIIVSYVFVVYCYSVMYLFLGNYYFDSFNETNISFVGSVYLSFTSISVGPSGIEPISNIAKIVVMSEIAVGLIFSFLGLSIIASLLLQDKK